MSPTLYIAFVLASVLLALTPGPNMSLIIASTLSGGFRAGVVTLTGTATGLAILTGTAALGMSSLMVLMSEWFDVIRWAGAVYLIALGILQVRGWWLRRNGGSPPPPKPASTSYIQGLLVALSNPKVMLFLGAFLPQFVDPALPPGPQLAILAVTFVVTLLLVDMGYTAVVARARAALDPRRLNALDGIAGGLLVVGGVVLATARRP
jgi:threonine/homoserine/homoserine lactone efflux protein